MVAGGLTGRFDKGRLFVIDYFLAALLAVAVMELPMNAWILALISTVSGINVAMFTGRHQWTHVGGSRDASA
jgi:hypothetical protein